MLRCLESHCRGVCCVFKNYHSTFAGQESTSAGSGRLRGGGSLGKGDPKPSDIHRDGAPVSSAGERRHPTHQRPGEANQHRAGDAPRSQAKEGHSGPLHANRIEGSHCVRSLRAERVARAAANVPSCYLATIQAVSVFQLPQTAEEAKAPQKIAERAKAEKLLKEKKEKEHKEKLEKLRKQRVRPRVSLFPRRLVPSTYACLISRARRWSERRIAQTPRATQPLLGRWSRSSRSVAPVASLLHLVALQLLWDFRS